MTTGIASARTSPNAGILDTGAIQAETPGDRSVRSFVTNFCDRIGATEDLQSLDTIEEQLQRLTQTQAPNGDVDQILEALSEKRNELRVGILAEHLHHLGDELIKVGESAERLIEAKEVLDRVKEERLHVTITRTELRLSIDDEISEIEQKIRESSDSTLKKVLLEVPKLKEEITKTFATVKSFGEFEYANVSPAVKRLELLHQTFPDSSEITEVTSATNSLESQLLAKLEANRSQAEQIRQAREISNRALAQEKMALFSTGLSRCRTEPQIESFVRTNPTALDLRSWCSRQGESIRAFVEEQINTALKKHREVLRLKELIIAPSKELRTITYGAIKFPVFIHEPQAVRPVIVPESHAAMRGMLVYEGPGGFIAKTAESGLPLNLSDAKVISAISRTRADAQAMLDAVPSKVPTLDPNWKRNAHTEGMLEDLARKITVKQNVASGGVILAGEAGAGKNVLIEMFSADTNRPLFTLHCNRHSEKEDITQAVEYDAKDGTYRLSSEFIIALQTPGAVIHLEEINTLPPGVSKMLNGLFGFSRSIQLPFGGVIKADPSVILLGSMNPDYYIGTKPLPKEFEDRSLFVEVTYPPISQGPAGSERWTSYEAEAARMYLSKLRGLKDSEFKMIWDGIINHDRVALKEVQHLVTRESEKLTKDLHYLVRVADRFRASHRATVFQNAPNGVPFTFSLRSIGDVAGLMDLGLPLHEALLQVASPKTADPTLKAIIQGLIDSEVPKGE